MSSPREKQKLATRDRVRKAALELFSSAGFDATTTKAVAERAEVATGTVFVHAKDKVDLLCLVMHDRLEEATTTAFTTLPGGASLREQLLHVFGGVLAMYGKAPELAAPFIKHLPGATGPNAERVNALTFDFLGRLAALIESAKARGEVDDDVSSLAVASNLFALYFFALFSWIGGFVSHEGIMPALEGSFDLQLRGLRTRRVDTTHS
ncbi:MAG: TetR/AcrR family transcriptional regulator [Polyangiaceae bacterium]|nr:TetR/AcrR family transcriptional regulator [Polyangiaceae bacterium]